MNYTSFATYMRSLALSHTQIDHSEEECGFFIYEREDVLAGVVNSLPPGKSKTTMYILPYGVSYNDRDGSVVYQKDLSYMILVFVDDVNNMIDVSMAMDKSELICHQINKKIKSDTENGIAEFDDIEFDDVEMSPILRFHGNFYGFQVFMPVLEEDDLCLDDNVWKEVEEDDDEEEGEEEEDGENG